MILQSVSATSFAGEGLALASALFWAMAVMLFRKSGELVPPFILNLFKCTLGLILIFITLLVAGTEIFSGHSMSDTFILLLSGAIGMGFADTLYLAALNRLGPSRTAICTALFSPAVLILSSVFLSEPFGSGSIGAVFLIVVANILGNWRREASLHHEAKSGFAMAIGSVLFMAVAIVIAKPILSRESLLWVIFVRFVGGVGVMLLQSPFATSIPEFKRHFTPNSSWKWMLPGSIIGTYISVLLWIAGIKFSQTTIAIILGQLSLVFITIFSRLFFKEAITKLRWVAVAFAVLAGVVASFSSH